MKGYYRPPPGPPYKGEKSGTATEMISLRIVPGDPQEALTVNPFPLRAGGKKNPLSRSPGDLVKTNET